MALKIGNKTYKFNWNTLKFEDTSKKNTTNKTSGITTMSGPLTNATTVYTMNDMNKKIQQQQNKQNLKNMISGTTKADDYLVPVSTTTSKPSSSKTGSSVTNNGNTSFEASVPSAPAGGGGYSYSSGGGVSVPAYNELMPNEADFKLDLTAMLKAFDDAAAASRNIAQSTYDTTRSDLLSSLKRFQEDYAKNVENQRRSYLIGQANLEDARAEANRANRISAASRGLAGSGLQQLAQLQNLLNQSQDISDLATSNQAAVDNLRLALTRAEEDNTTDLANALTARDNALQSIESTLGSNKANLQYQADQNAKNQYLNAMEAWRNREFQASENAKSRAMQQAEFDRQAAQQQASAQTLYDDTLNTLSAKLKKLSNASKASTLADYAAEAGLTQYTTETIKKMSDKDKANLKNNIAGAYAGITDANLSQLNALYYLPIENSKKNQQTVNDILAKYGNTRYYDI